MPIRPGKQCRKRGCLGLSYERHGYCEKHKHENWKGWQEGKGNRHERGYGNDWEKLARQIRIEQNNLCQPCLKLGIFTECDAVDHIKPKSEGGTDDPKNLQCICNPCHKAKTARERGGGVKTNR